MTLPPLHLTTFPQFFHTPTEQGSQLYVLDQDEDQLALVLITPLTMSGTDADALAAELNDSHQRYRPLNLTTWASKLTEAQTAAITFAHQHAHPHAQGPAAFGIPPLHRFLTLGPDTAAQSALDAFEVELLTIVTNCRSTDGGANFLVSIYTGAIETTPDWETILPTADGHTLIGRTCIRDTELATALADPRWDTHFARAFWVNLNEDHPNDEGVRTLTWIIEHYDTPIPDHPWSAREEAANQQ